MTAVEIDLLSDLAEDTHGIWEIFGFVRLHHSNLSDEEVFQEGMRILNRWWKCGWIELSQEPLQPTSVHTMEETFSILNKLKEKATRYFDNAPSIDITEGGQEALRKQSGAA